MGFEVGKKVIAIINFPNAGFKKGDVFPLLCIKLSQCGCILFDIGKVSTCGQSKCGEHRISFENNGVRWIGSTAFAPYDDSLSELTVEKILNSETLLNLN